jgi:serine-type D-Ala-D-Ala carboxypeptidase/endopeptidase (penicillin-binding protein 4)
MKSSINYLRYFVLALLPLTSCVAAESAYPLLIQEIKAALTTRCLDTNQTGVNIVNVSSGETVFSYNPQTALLPASTLKMVTTAAALHYLSPEYRFHTDLLTTGQRVGDTLQGDLILKGGGDPKLGTEQLWYFVTQLRESGIHKIAGRLIADASFFDNYDRAPSWDETRTQRAYDAKLSALSLNYNTLTLHARPAEQLGAPLSVWLEPESSYLQVDNHTKTTKRGKNSIAARRNDSSVEISGSLAEYAEEKTVLMNVEDPTRYTIMTFQTLLQNAGISVAGGVEIGNAPPNAVQLYRHTSPPLSMILKELNTYSNNFIAEQILKTLSAEVTKQPGSHTASLRLVDEFLQRSAINTQGLMLADGSGLSRENRFTAQAMTSLLVAMPKRFDIGPDFMTSLRVLGANGVESHRLQDSPAQGKIRAKTGTLDGLSALVGYVSSASGQVFAFALFLNNNHCGYTGADVVENRIVNAIYNYGNISELRNISIGM